MRAVKLIKSQSNAAPAAATQQAIGRQRAGMRQARETAADWVKDYHQKKPANPREEFAHLFDLVV